MPALTKDTIKILLVDDEPTLLGFMNSILEGHDSYSIESAADGEQALAMFRQRPPDLLITDLVMPRLSGERLIEEARLLKPDLTVVVATGNGTVQGAVNLMRAGIFDFLAKPFQIDELLLCIERATERIRWAPLSRDSQAIVGALMAALEAKDPYLKNHSSRVAAYSRQLSLDLGLSFREALLIERAGLVHDLGKIGVPEAVLHKTTALNTEEFAQIKKHPGFSAGIIRPLKDLQECVREVYHHHERIDGLGYPDNLKGAEIPVGARIIAVCDAFDAMASDRPYRPGMPLARIREALLAARGTQLEGDYVEAFLKRMDPK